MAPSKSSKSSASAHKSTTNNNNNTPPRPKPHTAATVIPTLHPVGTAQVQRCRAKTSSARPSADLPLRQRAGTTSQGRPAPPHLNLSSRRVSPPGFPRLSSLPVVLSDRPSSPIPIPPRQKEQSPPTTPLTARARSPIDYFGLSNPRPHISESLTPYYTTRPRRVSSSQPAVGFPNVQRGFVAMGPRPGSPLHGYRPTSPLSPAAPVPSLSVARHPEERRPAKKLGLSNLPKFHPANFPSKDPTRPPPSPHSSRSATSQPRSIRGSDAQQKLHQYQRELIANATQSSRSLLSGGLVTKPDSPRLTPLKSPIDPMTPLALGGQGDYLLAGSSSSPSGFPEGDGREMVEQLVRRENERRSHPEARSGSVSPAVSPAGGRG